MTKKYNFISNLYDDTSKKVVSSPANWKTFLRSACYNFRLRFDEQLLVFAQRPDATAVLEIERWNKSFGRWVNKGAVGIAVFSDENRNTQRLKHYFDISDTHESKCSRPVPIWTMKDEYSYEVKIKGNISQRVTLGNDVFGNITRIDNRIERLTVLLNTSKAELENTERQFETAKNQVEKPFPQEEELEASTARLDELNILLNLDKSGVDEDFDEENSINTFSLNEC